MSNRKFTPNKQTYFKRNFSEAIQKLVPNYYTVEDKALFGEQTDPIDLVLNSHINTAASIDGILNMPRGLVFSSLSSYEGITPFFDKNNTFSEIDKFKFEKTVLFPLNKSLGDFGSSSAFYNYLSSDFIPYLNSTRSNEESVDEYCHKLGWFYLLATSGASEDVVQPSSVVIDYFVNNLFLGNELTTYDGINALTEYLWKNQKPYIPEIYTSGSGEYVSGYQQLDSLKAINKILFSDLYLDRYDTYVADAFSYFDQTAELTTNQISNGAFERMLRAFSFAFADQQDETNRLETLYDLQDCPDEYLPELAYLLGWNLLGYDRNKWRVQLANALSIYKKSGTKQSIQAALNTLFSEDGIDFDSSLTELWESYIPFLIFYALATESELFKDYSTLTVSIARDLGITNYDFDTFENNIRSGVDNILLKLFKKHPELFKLGSVPFPQNSETFVFRYRNKIYEIPPFEEIPYYITSEVTADFLESLEEFLYCYGVNEEFAAQVTEYIRRNTINDHSDFAIDNSWLIFTSSLQVPPNWDDLTSLTEKDKVKFLSLWNGKSSHYLLEFEAGSFNFSKVDFTPDSKYAIIQSSRLAQEFSPAHAVPVTRAYLSGLDDYDSYNTSSLAEIQFDYLDYPASYSSMSFSNNQVTGIDILAQSNHLEFSSLGRASLNTLFPASALGRNQFGITEIVGGSFDTSSSVIAPRTTLRRRNLKNAIDLFGYYDRTGFNPPIFRVGKIPGFTSATDSSLITRGLIPSSMVFQETGATCSGLLSSIPDVYKLCSPNHQNKYYGYYLSDTIRTRGALEYQTDLQGSSMYESRGSLDPLMYLIYRIEQRKLESEILKDVLQDPRTYADNVYWYNFSGSEANKRISCGNTVLSSIDGYFDYTFGRKLHTLYYKYITRFNNHPLVANKYTKNVADILTHCYGSILKNSDFELRGLTATEYGLYTSSFSNPKELTLRSPVFSSRTAYGTVSVTFSPYSVVSVTRGNLINNPTTEYINSKLIEDVDVIHTAGASNKNSFTIIDLQSAEAGSYAKNNCLIKLRSVDSLPRLRFVVDGSNLNETIGNYRNSNFLNENHEYSIIVKGLAAQDSGEACDARLGVWVHTLESGGAGYHYNPTTEGWDLLNFNEVTLDNILDNYTQELSFDQVSVTGLITKCHGAGVDLEGSSINSVDPALRSYASVETDPLDIYEEQYFSEVSATFNTKIGCRSVYTSALHNPGQTYIVEVFMIPNIDNYNKFILLDNINLRDDTLYDLTKLDLAGDPIPPLNSRLCNPIQMELEEADVRTILRSFAVFAGKNRPSGFLSRQSFQTSSVHYDNGGSRLSYRDSPEWYGPNKVAATKQITNIDIY